MFITIALIPIFKTMALKMHVVDMPNERKVHKKPMPKVGGVAFALGALIPLLFLYNYFHMDRFIWSVMIGAWIIVLFGFLDDVKDLGYKTKFTGQILATLIVVFYGGLSVTHLGELLPDGYVLPRFVAVPVTVITIIGVTNAINLADGLDGLAGGISLLSFLCIGYLGYWADFPSIALVSVAMVGGLFGFLGFNTFPATVFMGDAGSQLIGFLAITLSLQLTQESSVLSPVLPLLLLGFPVLDTLTVMATRKVHGRPVFVADKNHFHHKLMNIGLYHNEAVFLIYVTQTVLVTFAFMFRYYSEWLLLSFYIIFTGSVFFVVLMSNKMGYRFGRPGLFDRLIKQRLHIFKEEKTLIKISFRAMQAMLVLIIFFKVFIPGHIPVYISATSGVLTILIALCVCFFKTWVGVVLRAALYLTIPYLIYISESSAAAWVAGPVMHYYNISFIILSLFAAVTVKLSRRTRGFRATPMDFIILFIAIVIPNLPDVNIQSFNMGMIATKIIIIFFSLEVWISELRGELGKPVLAAVVALVALAVRGVM